MADLTPEQIADYRIKVAVVRCVECQRIAVAIDGVRRTPLHTCVEKFSRWETVLEIEVAPDPQLLAMARRAAETWNYLQEIHDELSGLHALHASSSLEEVLNANEQIVTNNILLISDLERRLAEAKELIDEILPPPGCFASEFGSLTMSKIRKRRAALDAPTEAKP